MVTSTELDIVDAPIPVALFAGATPADVIAAATDVANQFSDVVKQRRLSQRIGSSDHVRVEGWQTVGALVGVFAVKDGGVREIPWPILAALGDEPEDPRTEAHRAWELHRALLAARDLGRSYGFTAAFRAVKDGREIGWGEGRCERSESTWVSREDYALSGMAQTRGQVRSLSGAMRFIVKLAGYATTPAEEMTEAESAEPAAPASPYGALIDADGDAAIARVIETLFADLDGTALVRICNRRFKTDHLPDAAAKMVDAIRWARDSDSVRAKTQDAPISDVSAPEGAPPDD